MPTHAHTHSLSRTRTRTRPRMPTHTHSLSLSRTRPHTQTRTAMRTLVQMRSCEKRLRKKAVGAAERADLLVMKRVSTPRVLQGHSKGTPRGTPRVLQGYSNGTPRVLQWYSNGTPMVLAWRAARATAIAGGPARRERVSTRSTIEYRGEPRSSGCCSTEGIDTAVPRRNWFG